MLGYIHSGEGNFGIDVNASENVSAHARSQHGNAVKRNQKSVPPLSLELCNASSCLIMPSFGSLTVDCLGMVV